MSINQLKCGCNPTLSKSSLSSTLLPIRPLRRSWAVLDGHRDLRDTPAAPLLPPGPPPVVFGSHPEPASRGSSPNRRPSELQGTAASGAGRRRRHSSATSDDVIDGHRSRGPVGGREGEPTQVRLSREGRPPPQRGVQLQEHSRGSLFSPYSLYFLHQFRRFFCACFGQRCDFYLSIGIGE